MNPILNSIKPVIEEAKHVSANPEAILAFADSLKPEDLVHTDWHNQLLPTAQGQEDYVAYLIIYTVTLPNTWGEPKWGLTVDGKKLAGSASVNFALRSALANDYPLLDPAYLASMPEKDLQAILTSDTEIPLLSERLTNLHTLGHLINQQFNDSFWNILEEGRFSVSGIVNTLTTKFPTLFCDEVDYHGHIVMFHKLAQVVASMLFEMHEAGVLSPKITGEEDLTAFADYKVPQILQRLDLIHYSPELLEKIKNKIELPYGSDEEVEIRAFTIHVIEEVVKQTKPRLPQTTAIRVDKSLWLLSQKPSADDLPHHRTRTLWY